MIEAIFGTNAKKGASPLEAAEKVISRKTMWTVPDWDCNRIKNPCNGICFAADVMRDAKKKGYEHAGPDYFTKLAALSRFPWKEIIITGGEPTSNPDLLKATLASISPERNVRIITNGDWILDKPARERIIDVIVSSNRRVKIDVSAHDELSVLEEKLSVLTGNLPEKLSVGIQLRTDEHYTTRTTLEARYPGIGTYIEEHDVLEMGQTKTPGQKDSDSKTVRLSLEKLMKYSDYNNQGIYLIFGENGTRVIANHETPYLVFPTPADITNPTDDLEKVLQKVIDFYANRDINFHDLDSKTALGYIEAAFRAGVPLRLSDKFKVTDDCVYINGYLEPASVLLPQYQRIMNTYYQIIAEESHAPITEIKDIVMQKMAERILEIETTSKEKVYDCREVKFEPMTFFVAEGVPHDPESLASVVAKNLWRESNRFFTEQELGKRKISNMAYRLFPRGSTLEDRWHERNFIAHLYILDILPEDLAQKLDRVYSRP